MSKAPLYWSMASRALPPTEPVLVPAQILFRPEVANAASDQISDQVPSENRTNPTTPNNSVQFEREIPFQTRLNESKDTQHQSISLHKEAGSEPDATFSILKSLGVSQSNQSIPAEVQQTDSETLPLHFSIPRTKAITQQADSDTPPNLRPPTDSNVVPKSEGSYLSAPKQDDSTHDFSIEHRRPTYVETSQVETGRPVAAEVRRSTLQLEDEPTVKQEMLLRLQPQADLTKLQRATPVDRLSREEFAPEASRSSVSPIQASPDNETKPELRIGSIVVHIEKPSPPVAERPVAERPVAPSAAHSSGPLAKGFSSFGFYQN